MAACAILLSGCHHHSIPLVGPSCGIKQLPIVKSISPRSGPAAGGTRVTITGRCFTAAATVRFGGVASPSVEVYSTVKIVATSPAGRGTVPVTVSVSAGSSARTAANQFRYEPPGTAGASAGASS